MLRVAVDYYSPSDVVLYLLIVLFPRPKIVDVQHHGGILVQAVRKMDSSILLEECASVATYASAHPRSPLGYNSHSDITRSLTVKIDLLSKLAAPFPDERPTNQLYCSYHNMPDTTTKPSLQISYDFVPLCSLIYIISPSYKSWESL